VKVDRMGRAHPRPCGGLLTTLLGRRGLVLSLPCPIAFRSSGDVGGVFVTTRMVDRPKKG
jgi:hypothetical protein